MLARNTKQQETKETKETKKSIPQPSTPGPYIFDRIYTIKELSHFIHYTIDYFTRIIPKFISKDAKVKYSPAQFSISSSLQTFRFNFFCNGWHLYNESKKKFQPINTKTLPSYLLGALKIKNSLLIQLVIKLPCIPIDAREQIIADYNETCPLLPEQALRADDNGNTLAHNYVLMDRYHEIADIASYGADFSYCNAARISPLAIARKKENWDIVTLMTMYLSHEAEISLGDIGLLNQNSSKLKETMHRILGNCVNKQLVGEINHRISNEQCLLGVILNGHLTLSYALHSMFRVAKPSYAQVPSASSDFESVKRINTP